MPPWVMHDSAGKIGSHFPSAPLAANGAVAVAPAVDRRHLFFVLISAVVRQSLCGEGRAIHPHYYQLTRPTAVAELWTVTVDHQLDLCLYQT